MTATQAKSGHGTLFQRNGVTIAEVRNINGISVSRPALEATNMGSAGWKEFIAGLREVGDIKIDVNWLAADATQSYGAGALADLVNGTLQSFSVIFPFSPTITWSFSALVTDFMPTAPLNGVMTASITCKISGAPTLA